MPHPTQHVVMIDQRSSILNRTFVHRDNAHYPHYDGFYWERSPRTRSTGIPTGHTRRIAPNRLSAPHQVFDAVFTQTFESGTGGTIIAKLYDLALSCRMVHSSTRFVSERTCRGDCEVPADELGAPPWLR